MLGVPQTRAFKETVLWPNRNPDAPNVIKDFTGSKTVDLNLMTIEPL